MKNFQDKVKKLVPEMRRVSQIHFIGIGGAGMSGIAEVLLNEGYQNFRFGYCRQSGYTTSIRSRSESLYRTPSRKYCWGECGGGFYCD